MPPDTTDQLASALAADASSERSRSAADTVAALRPHLRSLGITRVARQTGLDRIGLPCFAAFRPNAQTLATSAGKGLTDAAAMASAIMEAAEQAVAEIVPADFAAAPADLDDLSFMPLRQMPMNSVPDPALPIGWMAGEDLASGGRVLVPHDVVSLAARPLDIPGLARSTNGLASGNNFMEAAFGAVCELIERDAATLWSLRSAEAQAATAIDPDGIDDEPLSLLRQMIAAAGLELRLFDQTSDLQIPTIQALIGPAGGGGYFDLAAGTGTHPVAAQAALRAVAEAAQSRITTIAGSRDDLDGAEFSAAAVPAATRLLEASPVAPLPEGLPRGTPLAVLWARIREVLVAARIDVTLVSIAGLPEGFSAVKAVSALLEDREANHNWRPGRRAVSFLLGAA